MEADGVGQFGCGTWKSDFHWSIPVSCRLTDQGRCAMKLLFANLCIPKQSSDFTLFFLLVWPEGALTVGAPRFSSMLEESPSSPKPADQCEAQTSEQVVNQTCNLQFPRAEFPNSFMKHAGEICEPLHTCTKGHLVWSGRTAAFDTLWKRKSCFSFPSYRAKNTPCVYRSFILTVATFTYVVLVYIHPSSPDSVGLGCRC